MGHKILPILILLLFFVGFSYLYTQAISIEGFSDTESYQHIRLVQDINEQDSLATYDSLSFLGKEKVYNPVLPFIGSLVMLFASPIVAAKLFTFFLY